MAIAILILLSACGGSDSPTGEEPLKNRAHIEVTGDTQASIDLAFVREGATYFPPDGIMVLNWENEQDQKLTLGPSVFIGTKRTPDTTLQMNVTGAAGFSHNAFGDECEVTITRAEPKTLDGTFICSFHDIEARGAFNASF